MKRLGVDEMTRFVRDGFLKLEGLVPKELCDSFRAAYVQDCTDDRCGRALLPVVPWGTPLARAFAGSGILARVFALPRLSGAGPLAARTGMHGSITMSCISESPDKERRNICIVTQ